MFHVKILVNTEGAPVGKLADAELHFTDGPLAGVRLVGFGIWTRRDGRCQVTVPSRQYVVNGERRSFTLLRPIADAPEARTALDGIRATILDAYQQAEQSTGGAR